MAIRDMLRRQCEQIRSATKSLFSESYLARSKLYNIAGTIVHRGVGAVLPCGSVQAGDLVWLSTNVVALVVAFWKAESGQHISVQVYVYTGLDRRGKRWRAGSRTTFFASDCVVSALMHSPIDGITVFVIPPVYAYF